MTLHTSNNCQSEIPEVTENEFTSEPARKNVGQLEERLARVETELAELKAAFDRLMGELM